MIKLYDGNKHIKVEGAEESDAIKELNLDDNDWEFGGSYLWNSNSYIVEDMKSAINILKKNHKGVYTYEV